MPHILQNNNRQGTFSKVAIKDTLYVPRVCMYVYTHVKCIYMSVCVRVCTHTFIFHNLKTKPMKLGSATIEF